MKIIVIAMYWHVDLLPDGFLIFTAGSFRMVGHGYLVAQFFGTGALLPPGLGKRHKG